MRNYSSWGKCRNKKGCTEEGRRELHHPTTPPPSSDTPAKEKESEVSAQLHLTAEVCASNKLSLQASYHKTRHLDHPSTKLDPDTKTLGLPQWSLCLVGPCGPRIQICPHRPRSQAHHCRFKCQAHPSEPRHQDGLHVPKHQACLPGDPGTRPDHPRTPAASLPMYATRLPTKNLWTGWPGKSFAYWSQSTKTGRGAYFLKCANSNARPWW